MNNSIDTYFNRIKPEDSNKIKLHMNEVQDPTFEKYIKKLIEEIDVKKIMNYPNERKLYEVYSSFYDVLPQYIAVGHGADEIIGRIFYLLKDKMIFIGDNEYPMARQWADIYNMKVTTDVNKAEVIYIGNPNSYNGVDNTKRINYHLAMGKKVIVDEVYSWFNDNRNNSFIKQSLENENLWVVDSMSKSFGFCGLRAGVVFSTKKNIEALHMLRQGFTSNSLSCELIPKVLGNKRELMDHIQRLKDGKEYLESKFAHEPSCGPYSLLKINQLTEDFSKKVLYLKGTKNARVACATIDVWKKIGV